VIFGRYAAALVLIATVSVIPSAGHVDTVADEASFVSRINDLRTGLGLPPLAVNDNLVAKARGWAATMAGNGSIWHSTLSDGVTAGWQRLGENVGMGGSVDVIEAAFVASPHHYENLVDPGFRSIGVGVSTNGGTLFVAEEFMQPAPPPPVRQAAAARPPAAPHPLAVCR